MARLKLLFLASQKWKISQSAVSKICASGAAKATAAIAAGRSTSTRSARAPTLPHVDAAVSRWFTSARASNVPVTGDVLRAKAAKGWQRTRT